MGTKKFFILLMMMFMLFAVSGCGGSGSNTQTFSNNPISPDKPAPAPETKSDDIPTVPVPEPAPQSQDKPISTEPIPTPTDPIIPHDPIPVRYTVSFNSNGGSTVSSITVLSGHTISKPRNPKKYGCTFKGWYKDSALTQIFTFGADGDKVTANITLYAKWIEDSVLAEIAIEKVSIGYQDGDSASHVTRNITLPQNIDISGDVANIIWSSNNEKVISMNGTVTRQSTDVTVILTALSSIGTADKSRAFTLKVIHAETPAISSYTISFNSNGGSAVSNITVTSGNTVTQPATPSRSGYTFGGWFKDSALTQAFKFGSNGDKVTSNITLYAKWIETDILRAEVAIDKVSIGYQSGDSASNVTKNITLPTSVNASGDVSISWSSNNPSVISNSGAVTRPSGNDTVVVLTATATAGSVSRTKTFTVTVLHETTPAPSGYTVTFDSNGGSTVDSINVSSGGTVNMPENPTRDDYVFIGWFKDEAFTETFTFGTDGDKITRNTTLYAQWVKTDTLHAEYALGEIVIGYVDGDNPKYVTQNLSLPTKAGDATITWASSNASVISSSGTVTRPNGSDAEVTLTATARSGTEAETKEFSVKVIRARSRVSSDVEVIDIQNAGSGDLSITYNASGDQIVDIEGNYSKLTINNADDALDAIQAIHEALGINNPYEELQTFLATSDSYGSEYSFHQVYKGVKVFGRSVMASTNASGDGDFLHSSFLASSMLDSADMRIKLSASEAEDRAKASYSGNISADTARTELIVYSLEDYEEAPVYAYIVRVYGMLGGDYIDDSVFVNADTGEIIIQYPNTCNIVDDVRKASGDNEFGHNVSFDVVYELVGSVATYNLHMSYVMRDPELHIRMNSNILGNVLYYSIHNEANVWTDSHVVTVYANMREIMRWWKENFDRDAIDGHGTTVDVIPHAFGDEDNAAWNYSLHRILTYDRAEGSTYDYFCGAAVDVMTHETTHGVVQYVTGGLPNKNATGAMNEGYADIFGCIKDENWQIGDKLFTDDNPTECIRDIEEPYNLNARRQAYELYTSTEEIYNSYKNREHEGKEGDYGVIHQRSLKISHAAYLMHQSNDPANGLTWGELAKVWYKSLHMGLSASSKFEDVRRCVLWSAQEMNLPANKIAAIKSAFDKVKITDSSVLAKLSGTVTDYSTGSNLSGVDVVVFDGRISDGVAVGQLVGRKATKSDGSYSFEYEAGTYPIMMMKEGYVVFQGLATISKDQDTRLDVGLVRPGNGSVRGTIRQTSDSSPLQEVTVNIRSGWNVIDATILQSTTTDAEGHYSFTSINNGYYTVELVKRGYETVRFNATVSGNTTGQEGHISEDLSDNRYEIFNEPMTWREAKTRCEELGGHLATITSEEEYNRILAMIPPSTYAWYWLGAKKDDTSGNWQWITGEPFVFTKWQEGEPNNQGEVEQCLELTNNWYPYEDWGWNDENGDFTATGFVCEWDSMGGESLSYDISIDEAHFPDEIFRNYVSYYIDSDDNGVLSKTEIENTIYIDAWSPITSLKGIEYFTALQELRCNQNSLTELNVSKNTALRLLYCENNQLTALNIRGCTSLQDLRCSNNQLTELNVSENTALQILLCDHNQLTTLSTSGCTSLKELNCEYNQLTALNISDCASLRRLYCYYNQLTVLDVSRNTSLQELWCEYNQLITLNVSNNIALKDLRCNNNHITTLDLSNCSQLNTTNVIYDEESVNITWPNTTKIASEHLNATSSTLTANVSLEILAILPPFTPSTSGTYTFTVSLDRTPPEGSTLVLLTDSDDLNGSFAFTESLDVVTVSADFTAGRTYSPVIVAKTEQQEQSGGCNSGVLGIALLIAVLLRKRRC